MIKKIVQMSQRLNNILLKANNISPKATLAIKTIIVVWVLNQPIKL